MPRPEIYLDSRGNIAVKETKPNPRQSTFTKQETNMQEMTPSQFYAANVQRWHTHETMYCKGDNIADHQERCADLASDFVDDLSLELENAILHHDQAEVLLGDMPAMTKRDFPRLVDAWSEAEFEIIARYNIPQPRNEWEENVLKFVDRLDAYMMIRKHCPEDLTQDDMREARRWLLEMCWHLGFDMDLLCEKVGPCHG